MLKIHAPRTNQGLKGAGVGLQSVAWANQGYEYGYEIVGVGLQKYSTGLNDLPEKHAMGSKELVCVYQ